MNMFKSLYAQTITPIIIIAIICSVFTSVWIHREAEKIAVQNARQQAMETATQFKLLRGYYTKNIISVVKADGNVMPGIQHKNNAKMIPLPATMLHDLSATISEQSGTQIKLYSKFPFPNRQSRQMDAYQQAAWQALSTGQTDVYSEEAEHQGEPVLRVGIADKMVVQACVGCHNAHPDTPKNDWKLNDVRGVLEVTIPLGSHFAVGNKIADWAMIMMVVMLILVMVLLAFMLKRQVSGPLMITTQSLEDIATGEGDLTKRLDSASVAEIDGVSHAFNQFAQRIQGVIRGLGEAGHQLEDSSHNMTDTFARSMALLDDQQKDVTQVATAINQMTATAQHIADNVAGTVDITQRAEKEVSDGNQQLNNTVQCIAQLEQEMQSVASSLEQLQSDSEEIGKVLGVIGAISEQTNLLALNAAIEAARAGEQGRGFAVVADEVRTLAGRTQESTGEISKVIEHLKNSIQKVVSITEHSTQQAKLAASQADDTTQSFLNIAGAIAEINEMTNQIASATEQQSSVSQAIEENIESVRQSAGQVSEQTEIVQAEVNNVVTLSEQLHADAQRFKV